eukprot:CAMPEP_0181300756 /NCGR_PEP_ID=MMETSP1101-20121128/7059_1 /TAXON_ID=46948 /ORGANISM="Rhodomonas abbreviata, Strain Caron Lab Isolate" /LENGTH=76 /DNA_ID=CAMNT_0023406013 /DNA_START=97 /DNA_END=327 /DNA_ORIENTATION=+
MGAASSTGGVQVVEPPPWREKGSAEEEKNRKTEFERRRKEHYAGVAPSAGMGRARMKQGSSRRVVQPKDESAGRDV